MIIDRVESYLKFTWMASQFLLVYINPAWFVHRRHRFAYDN